MKFLQSYDIRECVLYGKPASLYLNSDTNRNHSMEQSPSCKYIFRYSRNSAHFMEPKSSLSHLQKPLTCLYSEPDRSNPFPPFHFFKLYFNIILLVTSESLKFSFFSDIFTKPCKHISSPHICYMPYPSHFLVFWLTK
jgi:hypothetical protein